MSTRGKETEFRDIVTRLEEIYDSVDGYALSRAERKRMRGAGNYENTEALQYGEYKRALRKLREIDFNGFLPLLRAAEIKPGDKFVDIGSGTGKAVLLAACCFPLSMSLGVEIMQPLHDAALKSKSEVVKCKPAILKMHESSIKLIHGDSFKLRDDWLNADVLYCPCTCFTDEMMNELTSQLPKLKHGARVITTSRQLELPCLRQLTSLRAKYKRGMLQFFVYKYESPALENIKSKEANATDARASHVGKRQKIDSSQPRNEKKAKSNEIQ